MMPGRTTTGFAASIGPDNRTYKRDKDGKFSSTGGGLSGPEAVQAVAYTPSTPEIKQALDDYGGEGPNSYQWVNNGLRGGAAFGQREVTDRHRAVIEGLDSAMREVPGAPADLVVHRNVNGKAFGLSRDQLANSPSLEGLTWQDHGFVSTASEPYASATSVTMRIHVPAGTKALSYSEKDREGGYGLDLDEVLLDRGLTFRVIADHGAGTSGRNLDVEVVAQ
jgi:hypothetical protein